ncbi:MAG: 2-amino-4-hydroxy-6-hydroxymethyldihydropteridine diphosphokinase [Bacteroidetes bacterium]|nr:2-amino-4-hydroxy-6-hydroxymethyldihydropteridine diphosphokinase [Bacteroidota bacterium]
MNKTFLLTGGNKDDRRGFLQHAKNEIGLHCGKILQESSLYETAAWGKTDQDDFLNQVLLVETSLTAHALMKTILNIEERMGRVREEKYGPRFIDIDILFFNDDIVHEQALIIPHPQIQYRRFVLEPLNEIAGNFVHPVLQKNIHTLLEECVDKLDVKKI